RIRAGSAEPSPGSLRPGGIDARTGALHPSTGRARRSSRRNRRGARRAVGSGEPGGQRSSGDSRPGAAAVDGGRAFPATRGWAARPAVSTSANPRVRSRARGASRPLPASRHPSTAPNAAPHQEESVARRGQPSTRARRPASSRDRRSGRRRADVPQDVNAVLARAVREIEAALRRGWATSTTRTKFQATALLLRDERAKVQEGEGSEAHKAEQLKRLDGIAKILATSAVRDSDLLALLADDAVVTPEARALKREMLRSAGLDPGEEEPPPAPPAEPEH